MKKLSLFSTQTMLIVLSFLIRKGLLKEDQAFAIFQSLPISNAVVIGLMAKASLPKHRTISYSDSSEISKYHKTFNC